MRVRTNDGKAHCQSIIVSKDVTLEHCDIPIATIITGRLVCCVIEESLVDKLRHGSSVRGNGASQGYLDP